MPLNAPAAFIHQQDGIDHYDQKIRSGYTMQTPRDPLSVDFRTLQMLLRVYALRSFTRAAEELGVNQSAVSYTIEKLRGVFHDPLFVRQGRAIHPTPRCEEIVQEAARLVGEFRQLAAPVDFDPATSQQRFTLACNYYERVLWVPQIVHTIRAQAPGITLDIIDASDIGHERLLNREADLLIGPFERDDPDFYRRRLYHERYVCLMNRDHPAAGTSLDMETYLSLLHVVVTYGGRWTSRYLVDLKELGHALKIGLRVPSPAGLEQLVSGSDLVATVPQRLSKVLGHSVQVSEFPLATRISIDLVWTAPHHRSAPHIWLRELIHRVVQASL
ncbi:LysR family transcriptional regulator [Mameliella alba]|uniref:LysR family transcriptional regulator n=2 Tax=Mameliella alba TaxID=561184 RepID=UPI002094DAC9|nr:LysR family transcriptional regulator [Mameliella alba]